MDYSYSWQGFKELAFEIQANNFFEVESTPTILIESWKRTFVSRMYYFCFHRAIEVAEHITDSKKLPTHLEFFYDKYKAHGDIVTFYSELGKEYPMPHILKQNSYIVSRNVRKLHTMRKECDYTKNLTQPYLKSTCEQSLIFSESIESSLLLLRNHFHSKIK